METTPTTDSLQGLLVEDEDNKAQTQDMKLKLERARMYESPFPDVDDMVVARVCEVQQDMGVKVLLLEYGLTDGIVMLTDIVKRRMRSVTQHLRPGQIVVLQVLRVDNEKGYIDLSKKMVNEEDEKAHLIYYNKSKVVHSIIGHVSLTLNLISMEDICSQVIWPLYKKYEHAYDAFELIANGDTSVFDEFEGLISPEVKQQMIEKIKHRLGVKPVKVQADIQVTCFSSAGISGIKPALKKAEETGRNNNTEIKVHLVRSPEYIFMMTCKESDKGIVIMNEAIEACKSEISKFGGECVVKVPPRVMEAKA